MLYQPLFSYPTVERLILQASILLIVAIVAIDARCRSVNTILGREHWVNATGEEGGEDKVGQTLNDRNGVTLAIWCLWLVLTARCETCQNVFFVLYKERRKGQ